MKAAAVVSKQLSAILGRSQAGHPASPHKWSNRQVRQRSLAYKKLLFKIQTRLCMDSNCFFNRLNAIRIV